ncbi:MAG TPA: DUF177 domain-containing protein [Bacteroidales bacterium]|nr:DUF177 domain-containing protein [Bacteroidales bacterium]
MERSKRLIVNFKGLADGKHQFTFERKDDFFAAIEYSEFEKGEIDVKVILDKGFSNITLDVSIKGQVMVMCDRCLDPYYEKIKFDGTLYAKYDDAGTDADEEIILLGKNDFEIDITHYVYESVCLSLPYQRVHKKGACNEQMIELIKKHKSN